MCVCDICGTEVDDSYDGRVAHMSQRHPAHLPVQLAAELLPPVNQVFDVFGNLFNLATGNIRPRRRKASRRRRGNYDTKRR